MKKIKVYIFYGLYSLVKYGPISQASPFKGKVRSYFAGKLMKKAGKNINVERGATFSSRISVGNNSGLGVNCRLQGLVTIGDDVMMGPEVYIYTTNHNFSSLDIPMRLQGYQKEEPVVIEDDVWIGSRVTILPGVTIGRGSVIGTGAVVTKSIPPFSIAAGVPAKVVKKRDGL